MKAAGGNAGFGWIVVLAVLCGSPSHAGEREGVTIPVVGSAAASKVVAEKALAAQRAYMSDLTKAKQGSLLKDVEPLDLPAGRYRFHALLALAPLNDLRSSAIQIVLRAEDAVRTVSAHSFSRPAEFVDIALDFVAPGDVKVTPAVTWHFSGERAEKSLMKADGQKAPTRLEKAEKGLEDGGDADEADKDAEVDFIDTEGVVTLEDAAKFPTRLMGCGFHVERLSPATVTAVRTDKAVYRTEDRTGQGEVEIRNYGAEPAKVNLKIEVATGLESPRTVHSGRLEVPALQSMAWKGPFPLTGIRWGAEFLATVAVANDEPSIARRSFAVTDNFWKVGVIAGHKSTSGYGSLEKAEAAANRLYNAGFNAFECFFWAPDDFGDFTPDTDSFFGGQNAYPGSVQGTKWLIEACHKLGISATVYANLWGGGGPPAFELMRKRPDWFGQANFHVGLIDDWDLMYVGKTGGNNSIWFYTNVNLEWSYDMFRHHAAETIAGHRMFGWDGTRYDSYYSADWTKKATAMVRETVEKEIPGYQWAYNSITPADHGQNALDIMVGGGGLIIEEGLREVTGTGGSLDHYIDTLLSYRDMIWPHGGHLGVIYDVPRGAAGLSESIYASAVLFASGAHPYYNVPLYAPFALRYSELLWDNRMRPLKDPEQVVSFGRKVDLYRWQPLAQTVTLHDRDRRLIVHLVNAPKEFAFCREVPVGLPDAIRDLPVKMKLPAGAAVKGVWVLTPETGHQEVRHAAEGDAVAVVVPDVRCWTMLVVDYASDSPLEEKAEEKKPEPEKP
jgi:hypothetical protein